MKKKITRIAAVFMSLFLIAAFAAGCRGDTGSVYVPPEFIYIGQSIPIPFETGDGGGGVNGIAYINDKLYYAGVSHTQGDEENFYAYTATTTIGSMNLDGTGAMELPNYTPPVTKPQDAFGESYINTMSADSEGNLWVQEVWNYYKYDIPDDFDPSTGAYWEYHVNLGNGTAIRKLDTTGAELFTLDLSEIASQREYFYVNSFFVDKSGNVYIGTDNWETGGMLILVFDSAGNMQFSLSMQNWGSQMIELLDGTVGIVTDEDDGTGTWRRVIKTINFAAKDFGDTLTFPNVGWQVYPGGTSYDVLISDGSNLFSYNMGDEEAVKLLNWLESDILSDNIQHITMLPDGRIIGMNYSYDRRVGGQSIELLILTKTPYSELPEKTVITLATFGAWNVRDSVISFNRASSDYRIVVMDYSEFNREGDWNAGLTRLSTEIISGKIPDILDVSNLPYKEYVGRGVLTDLYPFIDSDPDFNRTDFVDGAFRAAEIDGSLYQIFPSFYVNTLVGHPSIVGPEMGWNMDDFTSVLNAHPNADIPLGSWLTKDNFLRSAIALSIDEYINWNAGTTHFDTPNFMQLLEFAGTFPDEPDWDAINRGDILWEDVYVSEDEAIATGRQIMMQMSLYDFYNYQWTKAMFGGELAFKGFPTENRNGNSLGLNFGLAITERSRNKDAAWSYLREILSKDWQLANSWGLMTNKAAFDQKVKEAMEVDYGYGSDQPVGIMPMPRSAVIEYTQPQIANLTQSDVDKITSVISSASGTAGWNIDESIWNIIIESASEYFAGQVSSQDAARGIQNRVSILVSERS